MSLLMLVAALTATESPYVGEERRVIKSLSEKQVSGYLEGAGLGLARAAELNGYPGPRHVLDMADDLELTPDQRQRTEALFLQMQADAITTGEAIVRAERHLDDLFSSKSVDTESLAAATERIGVLQGKLRAIHLAAHLQQTKILTSVQRTRYGHLRGYGHGDGHHRANH